MEKDLFEDLHHIGILYKVEVDSYNLKSSGDGLDSQGASWYDINKLTEDMLSPFAWYVIKNILIK